jgi:hypothetical protein
MTTRVTVLIAMVIFLSMTAQAADTTLTLACQGTATLTMPGMKNEKADPISMGIIVDFTKNTVHGFGGSGLLGPPTLRPT